MPDKIIERIIERIPSGLALQIQTLSNEIFSLNDAIDSLESDNQMLKETIKERDLMIITLERDVIDLNKRLNRALSDFNQVEKKYIHTSKRLESALRS